MKINHSFYLFLINFESGCVSLSTVQSASQVELRTCTLQCLRADRVKKKRLNIAPIYRLTDISVDLSTL